MRADTTGDVEFSSEEMRTICSSALFVGFARRETEELLTRFEARRMSWSDGARVADESETPTRMGVLLSGFLHVYDSAVKGERHLVRIVRPGQILGASLVGTRPEACPAFVMAHGKCAMATLSLAKVGKCVEIGGGGVFIVT